MKKIEIPSLILKEKFKYHENFKEQLLKLIHETKDNGLNDHTNNMNDDISKLDWDLAKNFERPWVKLIINHFFEQLNNFSKIIGCDRILLRELWYQQYNKGDIHNWHIHGSNYTGVYYLEFNKNSPRTEFLFPNDLNKCFTIDVEEGDIITFPSYFIHRSQKNLTDIRKTIISFNIDFDLVQKEHTLDKQINVKFY